MTPDTAVPAAIPAKLVARVCTPVFNSFKDDLNPLNAVETLEPRF